MFTARIRRLLTGLLVAAVGCLGVAGAVVATAQGSGRAPVLRWSPPARFPGNPLTAIACPSERLCVAGSQQSVLVSTDPAGGAATWKTAISTPGNNSAAPVVQAVSCPTVSFCAAVTHVGVLTSTDPGAGPSAWKLTRVRPTPHQLLNYISCGSPRLCVVAEIPMTETGGLKAPRGGSVLVSHDPTGGAGAWSSTKLRDVPSEVFCLPRLCMMATYDGDILHSTNPLAGASSWHPVHVAGEPGGSFVLNTVACANVHYCFTFLFSGELADVDATRDPTSDSANAWLQAVVFQGRGDPVSGSCLANGLCVFVGPVDAHGDVFTSAGPGKPWTHRPVGDTYQGVSCPTASFCVAIGPSASSTGRTGLVSIGRG